MTLGVDYAWARPNLDQLWSAGYRFVCRYLSWLPNGKVIGAAERDALLAKGFDIFLNWEFDARDAMGGASAGDQHGAEAVRQAKALRYPAGSTIYFSVDFDVTEAQQVTVNAYIGAARKRCHDAGYRVGTYGGYYPTKRLFDAGLIDDGWQAYAWSGGQWDPRAALRQTKNGVQIAGADCDIDQTVPGLAYYGWRHAVSPPVPTPPTPLPVEDDMPTWIVTVAGDPKAADPKGDPGVQPGRQWISIGPIRYLLPVLDPKDPQRAGNGWVPLGAKPLPGPVSAETLSEYGAIVRDAGAAGPHTHPTPAGTTGPAQPEAA